MGTKKVKRDPFFDFFSRFFIEYLPSAKDCSTNTVASYRCTFRLLEEYYTTKAGRPFATMVMENLDIEFIEGFMGWLKENRKNSPATIGVRLTAIKSFLRFCSTRDALYTPLYKGISEIPVPVSPDRGLVYLSQKAISAILAQPNPKRSKGLRDLTFMVLMYESAARMSEMLDVRLCDIRTDDGILCLWLTGKGRKMRVVPIGVKAARHLMRYLEVFHGSATINSDDRLFFTVIHGLKGPMSADCAEHFIKKYAQIARNTCKEVPEKMHAHLFRHSRAMHLYQAGNDLIAVRDFLGHASIATTDIYARADLKMMSEAVKKVAPLDSGGKDWEDATIKKQLQDYLRLHGFA